MRAGRLAMVAVAVLLLAGCSEIPTAGPVQPGTTEDPNGTSIVYVPNPPAAGASPSDIVTGFLTAQSAGSDLRVAKQYLTAAAAKKWKPSSRVLVQAAQPKVSTSGTGSVTLDVSLTAKVDSHGIYTPTSSTVPLSFHLTQVSGQWRIDSAPDGLVLIPTVFQRNYKPLELQFFDQGWSRLVPDPRWYPSGPLSTISTDVVSDLVAGPSGPLSGGVTVNALHGATVESVLPTVGGVTDVALSMPGADPSADALSRMQQQLIQSLGLPTPNALRLIVNDRLASPVKALIGQTQEQSAFVVADGRFGTLSTSGRFTEDGALGKRIAGEKPSAVTVSEGQGLAAVLTGSGEVAAVTSSAARIVDSRSGVLAPTLDQQGWVYSESPDGLRASTAKGRSVSLITDLPDASVKAIEVSLDGTRMLVLVQRATGTEAFVRGILRNPDGTPTGLTEDQWDVDLGGNTGSAIDATWVDQGEVAVLVSAVGESKDNVQVQQLGGLASGLGDIPSATAIVGTSSESDLRMLIPTGRVFDWQDPSWAEESASAPSVSVLAVQR